MPVLAQPITINGIAYDKIGTDWSISVLPSGQVAASLRLRLYRLTEEGTDHAPMDQLLAMASSDLFSGQLALVSQSPHPRETQVGIIMQAFGEIDAALQRATDRLNFHA